jgi:hypothetical protein
MTGHEAGPGNGAALRDLEQRVAQIEALVKARFAALVPPEEIRAEFEQMDARLTEEIREIRHGELHDIRESLHQISMRVEISLRGAKEQTAVILQRLDETLAAVRALRTDEA